MKKSYLTIAAHIQCAHCIEATVHKKGAFFKTSKGKVLAMIFFFFFSVCLSVVFLSHSVLQKIFSTYFGRKLKIPGQSEKKCNSDFTEN